MPFAATWMNLEISVLSEVRQTGKDKYYMMEVTNRLKGLDLIDRVPEELWTEICNIV